MPRRDLKDPLPVDNAPGPDPELDSSGESQASEASINLLDSNNRNMFLTKVGITFMLYSLAMFCTAIFILIDIRRTTIVYRDWSLQTVMWLFLAVTLVIKIIFGFFGVYVRKLAKIAFPIDLFATVVFILGLYYYLDSAKTTTNYSYAPFVVIVCVNFFTSSFFFTLATLYHSRSKEFNYLLGTLLMTVFNVVAIVGLAYGWKQVVTITPWQYAGVGIAFLFINLYISVNSYYLINVRLDKFSESDAVWAFYCYWTDWVFAFWKNLFGNTSRIIRANRRLLKKKLEAKNKDKKSGRPSKAPKPKETVAPKPAPADVVVEVKVSQNKRGIQQSEVPEVDNKSPQNMEVKIA
jgi:hypothetical protein